MRSNLSHDRFVNCEIKNFESQKTYFFEKVTLKTTYVNPARKWFFRSARRDIKPTKRIQYQQQKSTSLLETKVSIPSEIVEQKGKIQSLLQNFESHSGLKRNYVKIQLWVFEPGGCLVMAYPNTFLCFWYF